MIWIEMSRDKIHGGGEWGFTKCLWSPAYKHGNEKSSWLFWNNLLHVCKGDIILHLRGTPALFVGYSVAASNGHKTLEKPPQAGNWNYASCYFRVLLHNFHEFEKPKSLDYIFTTHQIELIHYLEELSAPKNRFFVYQSNRLQCLNGAYLSKCDDKLLSLILDEDFTINSPSALTTLNIATSEIIGEIKLRRGHTKFSNAVKENYNNICCFPSCKVNDPRFLISSHIARWVDNPNKRGNVSNGLCLCLLHDKAFENGYFSLDDELRVILSDKTDIKSSDIFCNYIRPFEHQTIDYSKIPPDKEALKEHRFRCDISV